MWLLQIYQSHLKIYFPAFKEHKTANHGKDWGIQHPYPQCQQKKEKIHQGKFIYCCLIPNAWQIYFKGNIQAWNFLVFSSQNNIFSDIKHGVFVRIVKIVKKMVSWVKNKMIIQSAVQILTSFKWRNWEKCGNVDIRVCRCWVMCVMFPNTDKSDSGKGTREIEI